jgi:integrase/recombinase XerD
MTAPDLASLLDSWILTLRAERKSPETIRNYGDGVRRFLRWCEANDCPAVLDRPTVAAFVVDLLDNGAEAATARCRQLAVRRFSAWLASEGEIPVDHLLGTKPVKLDTKIVQPLTDDQLKALIKACAGNSLADRRDTAMLRLMTESGARAGEIVAMKLTEVDLKKGTVLIKRGKGGKARTVPFSAQTALALDRYVRARRTHPLAASDHLWLGNRATTPLGYDGLQRALGGRAKAAGVDGFHLHKLRHTFAERWLAAGGSEGGLQTVAGWSSPAMIARYTRARASERAADEARGLGLGDW